MHAASRHHPKARDHTTKHPSPDLRPKEEEKKGTHITWNGALSLALSYFISLLVSVSFLPCLLPKITRHDALSRLRTLSSSCFLSLSRSLTHFKKKIQEYKDCFSLKGAPHAGASPTSPCSQPPDPHTPAPPTKPSPSSLPASLPSPPSSPQATACSAPSSLPPSRPTPP